MAATASRPPAFLMLIFLTLIAAAHSKAVLKEFDGNLINNAVVQAKSRLALIDIFRPRLLPISKFRLATRGRADCTPGNKLSHAAAWKLCSAARIGIKSSTGRIGCRDVGCTSLEQVRCDTVLGIIAFKKASSCQSVVITGGTEKGHAAGTYSHYNGYKLDIALTACITNYIKANFRYSGKRSDGADLYTDGRGNVYALENNHWDILYK